MNLKLDTRNNTSAETGKQSGSLQGVVETRYLSVHGDRPLDIKGQVVDEVLTCISVNGRELASFMCSPCNLEELGIGFLYNERIINTINDLQSIHLSKNGSCVDIWLKDLSFRPPDKLIVTAGCGGGITFDDLTKNHEPLTSDLRVDVSDLSRLMRDVNLGARLYAEARGIHTAALISQGAIALQVEDIGRHNCLDKLAGYALRSGVDTTDSIIMSSGRISSEMVNKARRLQSPVVCSRTSPTSLSIALAERWNMTLIAYLRQDRMRVYTLPERVIGLAESSNN